MTPRELVEYASRAGLSVISVTDHDTVSGLGEALSVSSEVRVIPGAEFSSQYDCNGKTFRLHILGYGIDPSSPAIGALIEAGQTVRRRKHSLRLEYLKNKFGIDLSAQDREQRSAMVGKISLSHLLIEGGYADSIGGAIKKYMSAPDFPEGILSHVEVISGIIAAGGIPVYAHPLGGEGETHLSGEEVKERIELLAKAGIQGVECYYSRYTKDESRELLRIAERLGLLVSGGSDFHGSNKTVKIGALDIDGCRVSADMLSVLSALD